MIFHELNNVVSNLVSCFQQVVSNDMEQEISGGDDMATLEKNKQS